MLMFFRIERPTTQTFRPTSTATSIACCIRWTFEANDATSTRPVSTGMIWRKASPTSRSEPVTPGRSALVESPSSRSTPRVPSSASRPTSVRPQGGLEIGQVREVGQHQIDAEVLVAREREARVDDDDLAVGLEDGHILADLAEAAKRDDPGGSGHQRSLER